MERHFRRRRDPRHRLLICALSRPRNVGLDRPVPRPIHASANTLSISDTQIASIAAGILSRVLLHPMDCIKTRLQNFRANSTSTQPTEALLRFIAAEGLPGLYRGISGAFIGVIPYSLSRFLRLIFIPLRKLNPPYSFSRLTPIN